MVIFRVVLLYEWWSPRQLHIPVRTGGIFSFPCHRHQIEGTTAFSVSSKKQNGIAKVTKRSFPQCDSNPAMTVRSPVQSNALTHSATAPPVLCTILREQHRLLIWAVFPTQIIYSVDAYVLIQHLCAQEHTQPHGHAHTHTRTHAHTITQRSAVALR